jgi:hypothetical protein
LPRAVRNLPRIDEGSALIADKTIVAPGEIVTGLLHAGTKGVLASGSKAGKTWVLLDLAASIATGISFLKWATIAVKVLVINLEIPRAFMKKRLEIIKERLQLPNLDNLHVWNLRGHTEDLDTLLDTIIELTKNEGYALIIIDPIYKLMAGRSENMAGGVGALVQQIDRLVEKTGAAVVYAHHFTKGNAAKKKPIDRMSGSGVFARDADTIITLTEHEEEGCYAMEMTLRNLPPQPAIVVEWDFPVMVERPDLNPADLKRETGREGDDLEPLLDLLDEKPLTTAEWQEAAAEVGYSRATFFRKKQELEDGKRLDFDRKQKTWAQLGELAGPVTDTGSTRAESDKPAETPETIETNETAGPNTQGGQTSLNCLNCLTNLNTPDHQ